MSCREHNLKTVTKQIQTLNIDQIKNLTQIFVLSYNISPPLSSCTSHFLSCQLNIMLASSYLAWPTARAAKPHLPPVYNLQYIISTQNAIIYLIPFTFDSNFKSRESRAWQNNSSHARIKIYIKYN